VTIGESGSSKNGVLMRASFTRKWAGHQSVGHVTTSGSLCSVQADTQAFPVLASISTCTWTHTHTHTHTQS